MDKFFTMCTAWIEEKEYKKIINIILVVFVLIAPSISIIFLYKRELFLSLDLFRLMMICLVLNIILFIIFYVLVSSKMYRKELLKTLKLSLELKDEAKAIRLEVEGINSNGCMSEEKYKEIDVKLSNIEYRYNKNEEDIKEVNIGSRIIFETISDIVGFIVLTWGLYVNDILFNVNLSNDKLIKRVLMYLGIIIVAKFINIYYIGWQTKKFKRNYDNRIENLNTNT